MTSNLKDFYIKGNYNYIIPLEDDSYTKLTSHVLYEIIPSVPVSNSFLVANDANEQIEIDTNDTNLIFITNLPLPFTYYVPFKTGTIVIPEQNKEINQEILDYCDARGIKCHKNELFENGLIFCDEFCGFIYHQGYLKAYILEDCKEDSKIIVPWRLYAKTIEREVDE